MRRGAVFTLVAGALAVPAASAPAQQRAAVQRDWTRTVAITPEGGYRMGNPDAPVKLVEYLSLTCPHCAEFSAAAAPRLIGSHVRSGRLSLEYRNYVANGPDLAAAVLSRCGTPEAYFAMSHAYLASQREWLAKVAAMTPVQRMEFASLPPAEAGVRLAAIAGLDAIAARHGVTAARARSCLADQAMLTRIAEGVQAADRLGVQGTPSFLINGWLARDVHDWTTLEPLLRPPGR